MSVYHKLMSTRYAGALFTAFVLGLILVVIIVLLVAHRLKNLEDETAGVALRSMGCISETVHTYHSVVLGETAKSIWRCDGKLISSEFTNVLVSEWKEKQPSSLKALQRAK